MRRMFLLIGVTLLMPLATSVMHAQAECHETASDTLLIHLWNPHPKSGSTSSIDIRTEVGGDD